MRDDNILRFNPWGDDDTDYRVLDNRMRQTRVLHDCAICFEPIPVGSRVRAQREVWDGKAKTFYFCPACCTAMTAATLKGDIEPIEARTAIGMQHANTAQGSD